MAANESLTDQEENYFVPMADLLAGVIFILMILIMSLALVTREDFLVTEQATIEIKRVFSELERARAAEHMYLEPRETASKALQLLLERLAHDLDGAGVPATVNKESGSLSIAGELFFSTAHELSEAGHQRIAALATALRRHLSCVAPGLPAADPQECNDLPSARLDRLVIAASSRTLKPPADAAASAKAFTAAKALAVYSAVVNAVPALLELKNADAQPVIEFRGLGERPSSASTSEATSASQLELLFRMDVPPIPADIWRLAPRVPAD
jgi:hypothetical protein